MDKNKKLREFLYKIKQIESSGGKNLDHQEMKSGIHAGDAAVGQYGLMPNTINEIINVKAQQKQASPDVINLKDKESHEIQKEFSQNPLLEQELAESLAKKVLNRSGGELEKAAYMWNQGHNLDPEEITPDKLESKDYVKKFRKIKELFQKKAAIKDLK